MHDPLPKEKLVDLYIHENLSAKEIAEHMDMTHRAVKNRLSKYDLWGKDPAKFHLEGHVYNGPHVGYPRWTHTGTGHRVRVHRLTAIANGVDPYKVFSAEVSIDHINGCPLDNRPENLQALSVKDHGNKDGKKSSNGYSHKDYLRALVQEPPDWAQNLPESDE